MPCSRNGVVTPASLSVCSSTAPQPPIRPLSSTLTTSRCSRGQLDDRGVDRLDPARVDDGDADALGDEPLGDVDGHLGHRADGDDEDVLGAVAGEHVGAAGLADRRRCPRAAGPSGSAPRSGASSTSTASLSSSRSRVRVARGGQPEAGHDLQHRHVPHAVVAGAVVAGDAGPVEHEGDPAPVQGDVHQHLVERAVEERRVDRHDRVQPAHREAGGRGGGVLLGDPDVERAVGEPGLELVQPHRVHHRRGDRRRRPGGAGRCAPSRRRTRRSRSGPWASPRRCRRRTGPGEWNWSASCRSAAS